MLELFSFVTIFHNFNFGNGCDSFSKYDIGRIKN